MSCKKVNTAIKCWDKVVFITIRDRKPDCWYIVAILEVHTVLNSHRDAYNWYTSRGLVVPNNCMYQTLPLPIVLTAMFSNQVWYNSSLTEYHRREQLISKVAVCTSIYKDLDNPIVFTRKEMINVFGKVKNTQYPPDITEVEYNKMLALTK